MFDWIVRYTEQLLEPFIFVYLCKTELFEIEQFDHLTICKQMAAIWLNCEGYRAILGTIWLPENE